MEQADQEANVKDIEETLCQLEPSDLAGRNMSALAPKVQAPIGAWRTAQPPKSWTGWDGWRLSNFPIARLMLAEQRFYHDPQGEAAWILEALLWPARVKFYGICSSQRCAQST